MEFYYRAPGMAGGDKKKAEAIPDQIMAINTVDGYIAKVRLMGRMEPPPAAILAEAEKKIPDNLSPHLRASGALLATGKDLARAERYARKYLSQEPEPNATTHAVAHWRVGLILEKQGRKPEAIAALQTATKLDPTFEQAQKDLKRLR